METFEELGLPPALVEALAAEGIEVPTSLQVHAIPVLRRGNSAVLLGGPGGGVLVAYGAPLLDRIDPEGHRPRAIVLTDGRERAGALAVSLARLALDHRVGALGVAWAFPERASILFSTPRDLEHAIRSADVKLDEVVALVLDGASALLEDGNLGSLESILQALGEEPPQITLCTSRLTPAVRRFVDQHMKRAVFLPPDAATRPEDEAATIQRGTLRFRARSGPDELAVPTLVAALLEEGAAHVVLFVRTEDRAADLGDLLSLHGFHAGAPGDDSAPVWLGIEPLEVRNLLRTRANDAPGGSPVVTVSVDVPSDTDELDRRHGGSSGGGVVLVHPRELPHLRATAQEAGYALEPLPEPASGSADPRAAYLARVEEVLRDEDLLAELTLLEPLLERWSPAEVAASLSWMVRRRTPEPAGTDGRAPSLGAGPPVGGRPPAWVRLFLSIGARDGVGPGDLVGAILGESNIQGEQVGRIDVRETYSKVEVAETVADRVIRALNGTSIRGRSVRADFDRGGESRGGEGRSGPGGAPGRGSAKGGGARSPRPKGGASPRSGGGKGRGSGPPSGRRGSPQDRS